MNSSPEKEASQSYVPTMSSSIASAVTSVASLFSTSTKIEGAVTNLVSSVNANARSLLTTPLFPAATSGRTAFLGIHHTSSEILQEDFKSRLWFTYRHAFPAIEPTGFTSDAGWGCMLRSAQMMMGECLIRHHLGRGFRPKGTDQKYREIVSWFLDDMSPRCPFSLHRMAMLGLRYGKGIGQWHGPSTASLILRDLAHAAPKCGIRVHVVPDGGPLYCDATYSAWQTRSEDGLLILVPTRLGVDSINSVYFPMLREFFGISNFVGVAGGRPNSSLYFMGWEDQYLIYLDPHASRPCVDPTELDEESLSTFHCDQIRRLSANQMDPSLLLGFYCRNFSEWQDLTKTLIELNNKFKPIVSIAQMTPTYHAVKELDPNLDSTDPCHSEDEDDDGFSLV